MNEPVQAIQSQLETVWVELDALRNLVTVFCEQRKIPANVFSPKDSTASDLLKFAQLLVRVNCL